MQDLPDNLREELKKFVPLSILNDIACFVFYDDHPVQRKFCDITICTQHGEVKEYFKREEISSLLLRNNFKATEIRIVRNNNCQLYYLVASDHEVVILSRIHELKVHQRVSNMASFEVDDYAYNGLACLKVVQRDDAVPLVFDDKFQRLSDQTVFMNGVHVDDSMPVLLDLKRKLVQTRYSIACNMKSQSKLKDLRKLATFAAYQKLHPNLEDSMFHQDYKESMTYDKLEALKLQSKSPCIMICNQKLVIVLHVINKHKEVLEDITVLLHARNKPSIVYTTRLYQRKTGSPFWLKTRQTLQCGIETAIVVVVNLSELQFSLPSKIEFDGVISYKKCDTEFLQPFDYTLIPHVATMGIEIDVLANEIDTNSILAVMASTERVNLSLRIIGTTGGSQIPLPDLFWIYLGMEQVNDAKNIVIHRKSAHHVLNGVMVIFERNEQAKHTYYMAVYARSPGQVVSLINYIGDAIPFKVVVTSKNHVITGTADALHQYVEQISRNLGLLKSSYVDYSVYVLQQLAMILKYFDTCIVTMNYSKNPALKSKIGTQIDLFAIDTLVYLEFRMKLLEFAMKAIQAFKHSDLRTKDIEQIAC